MKPLQNVKNRLKMFVSERLNKSSKQQISKPRRLNTNDFKEEEDFFLFI